MRALTFQSHESVSQTIFEKAAYCRISFARKPQPAAPAIIKDAKSTPLLRLMSRNERLCDLFTAG